MLAVANDAWAVSLPAQGAAQHWMPLEAGDPPPRGEGGTGRGPRHRSSVKTSAYRGVAATDNGTWRARIRYGRYTVHLGRCAAPPP
jgi:hypothetical protein